MKQKLLLFLAFTFLTFIMMTRVVRAQTSRIGGAPIKGVIVKGNKTITYENDVILESPTLSTNLGIARLVIAKGEYPVDHSGGDMRVIVHLHEQQIIHRDLAARNFILEGKDAEGNTFTFMIEPIYVNGIAKDIMITYKGTAAAGSRSAQ